MKIVKQKSERKKERKKRKERKKERREKKFVQKIDIFTDEKVLFISS